MTQEIEIKRVPFLRSVAVLGFVLLELMLLASLVCVASIAAHGWSADRSTVAVMALAIWGRGLFVWIIIAIAIAIYNWTARRFVGITLEIAERTSGNEHPHAR